MWGSLMVRYRAHNPETENACEGSNPSPATKKIIEIRTRSSAG